MRAKKTNRTSQSVKYLLSADRRLQKISLRKIRERMGKSTPPARTTSPKQNVATPPVPPPPKAYSWRAIVVGFTCMLAAAALMTAGQPADEKGAAGGGEPSRAAMAPVAKPVPVATPPDARKPAAPKPAAASASRPPAASPSTGSAPKPAATAATVTPAANVAAKAQSAPLAPATVTITGCLGRDGDGFWLKDVSGAGAPRARSWRTGFLTRRSSRVELVDAPASLRLSAQVGARVAATGTLVNRDLRPQSVRRVAASCN